MKYDPDAPRATIVQSDSDVLLRSDVSLRAVRGVWPVLDPVTTFRPWEEPEIQRLRRRLHNAAIISAARAVGATAESARFRYWSINRSAMDWLFAHASQNDLLAIANALLREFLSADTFERLEGGQ